MSHQAKPLVLVVGAAGPTGKSITQALLDSNNFTVALLVRPLSQSKPAIQQYQKLGAQVRLGDIATDSVEQLREVLVGVDTIIISLAPVYADQRNVLRAAKLAGVKRAVPSEFGPYAPRDLMGMIDIKYDIREFITNELHLPYTFIEVGWWLHYTFPYPHNLTPPVHRLELFNSTFFGEGDKKLAHTSVKGIGRFVARIIADPRTLNQRVFTWDVEKTQKEAWEIAEKVTGERFSDLPRLSNEEILANIGKHPLSDIIFQYINILYVEGTNTVANAVASGALDARVLYPDYIPANVEEDAKEFYRDTNGFRRLEDFVKADAVLKTA